MPETKQNTLLIQLEGAVQDGGNVRLNDFIDELVSVKDTLNGIDQSVAKTSVPTTEYRIIDLKHGSAELTLEAIPKDKNDDITATVLDKFVVGIQQIQQGTAPEEFDSALLERFGKIGWVFGRKVTGISFARNGTRVTIGKTFTSQVRVIIGEDQLAEGSVDGTLDQINIHQERNIFVIYPTVGPTQVRCHFPPELKGKAIEGLGKYVGVNGKLRYKQRDQFPNAINVSEIEVHPDESELPSIFDLRGIAKGATGDLSSEAFVRKIRNANT
ncbi:MAG: hypothetical protein EPN89_12750 [Methylovulum sp.]|nr:MAG: hypothetical protein EPN89_12750 [Methylovulum sp.]